MNVERVPLESVPDSILLPMIGDSFFMSRGFADLWRARGGRPVAWVAWMDGVPAGLLPGVEFRRGPYVRFTSMPDGCYGGIALHPDRSAARAQMAGRIFDALRRAGYARAHVFDFHGTVPCSPGFDVERGETVVVDTGDPDWLPPDRKLQGQIRKARREGVRIERFDWVRHGEAFLALDALTAHRHGCRPRYDTGFYRALARLAQRDERIVWVWCGRDGHPVCSHIYFVERGMLQAWQSVFDRRFSRLKPNPYIRFAVARRLARRGVTRLNLGATPAGAAGLAQYKGRWGGARMFFLVHVRDLLRRVTDPRQLLLDTRVAVPPPVLEARRR